MRTSSAGRSLSPFANRVPLVAGLAVLAATGVVVAATHHAPVTAASPIVPRGAWLDAYRAGIVAAFVGYAAAIVLLRRRGIALLPVIAIAVGIQLTPLAAPLLLS